MIVLALTALVAVYVAAVFAFGYPALIIGALAGVVLAFLVIFALTFDGLFPRRSTDR